MKLISWQNRLRIEVNNSLIISLDEEDYLFDMTRRIRIIAEQTPVTSPPRREIDPPVGAVVYQIQPALPSPFGHLSPECGPVQAGLEKPT